MTGKPQRDCLDFLNTGGTFLLPLVIFVGGLLYTYHHDALERERLEWDRDAGFVKDLTSSNENERRYGLLMVQGLIKEKRFGTF